MSNGFRRGVGTYNELIVCSRSKRQGIRVRPQVQSDVDLRGGQEEPKSFHSNVPLLLPLHIRLRPPHLAPIPPRQTRRAVDSDPPVAIPGRVSTPVQT